MQEASVLKNKMGFTASDIVDGIPKDMNSLEIQIMLMSNGFKSDKKETDVNPQEAATGDSAAEEAGKKKCWRKMVKTSSPLKCLKEEGYLACPGEAILAFRRGEDFLYFIIPNTIAFVASLGVTLLLISGLPLKNKVVMWMLSMGS
ncbi:hypothetical protein K1719_039495 [Acacia pycnantha]|nr:hypothetical protein K1719_039495 [Acacia pycnantha]